MIPSYNKLGFFRKIKGGLMIKFFQRVFCLCSIMLFVSGCFSNTKHKVELEVKPMHITIDVNVKVDKALDDFFGDIDEQDKTMKEDSK